MLAGDLYTVKDLKVEEGTVSATINWNAAHPVFAGHFPGQPVVPGVCMVQLVEEVLELALGKSLQLKEAANLKFLHVIDPMVHTVVGLSLSYKQDPAGTLSVSSGLQQDKISFFKMNGVFDDTGV